ncbi:MAG: phosphate signaling complex protein PhoU [Armatimonadota bacterium]|nr:phosphate signaling complex protein PhoU [bacterium]MCS7309159.1 phosphate signaling complex protein PhoU [Armatimonadota bacterium]MDW8104350.1 phosphate signaling complex protein PhoU [Armatimonadota bacterium]MDW8289374.1 phosphate signaling complex protein PhoU [Armatimonadota bacterium]
MTTVRHAFDEELQLLQHELIEMGSYVEQMLDQAVQSLCHRDEELAKEIVRRDDVVDEMDVNIEMHCLRLLALQQPMARDLRLIGTVLKAITDLERIGDHSVDIAKAAIRLKDYPRVVSLVDVPLLKEKVCAMIRSGLDSFTQHDMELAYDVCDMDNEVDKLYRRMRKNILASMSKGDADLEAAALMLLVLYYLERCADHAVNVAERVVFVETGVLRQLAVSHRGEYVPEENNGEEAGGQ